MFLWISVYQTVFILTGLQSSNPMLFEKIWKLPPLHCDHRIDIIRKWWLIRTQQCLLNLKLATINSFETLFNEISGWNLRVWMSLVYSSWKLLNSIPKFRQTWCNLVEHMGFVVYMFQRFEREFCKISLLWPGWRHCNWCFFVSRLMTSVK